MRICTLIVSAVLIGLAGGSVAAATYLNDDTGVTVALGASMGTNVFNNVSDAQSLANTIDVEDPTDSEQHTQSSHIWYTSSTLPLELDFDLGAEYDLTTLHFWNYVTEGFDVDQIDFALSGAAGNLVATTTLNPVTGSDPLVSELIDPADYVFAFDGVRFVNATFSGTNGQVDFNNIGWTGTPSTTPIPLPPAGFALLAGAGLLAGLRARRG